MNNLFNINEIVDRRAGGLWRGLVTSRNYSPSVRKSAIAVVVPIALLFSSPAVYAADAANQAGTIDDLGFSGAMNDQLFSSGYRIENSAVMKPRSGRDGFILKSVIDIKSPDPALPFSTSSGDLIYTEQDSAIDDELEIRRFSTAIETSSGILTVGNDWSNFQDFLLPGETASSFASSQLSNLDTTRLDPGLLTTEQISWTAENGFSVALENELELEGETLLSQPGYSTSPSLILSWEGGDKSGNGRYSFSALGKEFSLDEIGQSQQDADSLGWGLNLAGGWRFGDLFAALKITLGNSIDSFILGKLGDRDTASAALRDTSSGESININPSLSYRLGESSNLHFSLNRFETSNVNAVHGIDTLDTIHLGYSWNPWPSTQIGIELVGKDVEGSGEMDDSSEVNFAASKRF